MSRRFCSRGRRLRASVESLEIRRLLSAVALVVNTVDDDTTPNAFLSLREAVAIAQSQAGDDEITFDPAVFTAGVLHEITPLGEPIDFTGANGKITIVGRGADVVAISGSQAGRSFDVEAAANVSMSNLSIKDGIGAGVGGGIRNLGTLSLSNVTLSDNKITGSTAADGNDTLAGSDGLDAPGGAIYSTGSLTMSDCTLSGNVVNGQTGGSAAFGAGDGGDGQGGAIYADGPISLTNCDFDRNRAEGGSSGQKIGADVDAATGDALGGAIYLGVHASGTLINVTFTNNETIGGSGAAASGAHVAGGGGTGSGGALYTLASTLSIQGSTFDTNTAFGGEGGIPGASGIGGFGGAAIGGAIFSQSSLFLSTSTVTSNLAFAHNSDSTSHSTFGNEALGGGLFLGGGTTIADSTLDHNVAGGAQGNPGAIGGFAAGGGIYLAASLDMHNSTLDENAADGGQGGSGNVVGADGGKALGGAIACDNVNPFNCTNCTIARNGAEGGRGGTAPTVGAAGQSIGGGIEGGDVINLTNTIIAENNAATEGPDLDGTFTLIHCLVTTPGESGYNMTGDSTGNVSGPALLSALGNFGGPTRTIQPQPGSAAIDNGDTAAAMAVFGAGAFDQRGSGFPRFLGTVDIGALESQVTPATFTLFGNGNNIGNNDTTPRTADNTAFGTAKLGTPIDRTFFIRNDGGTTLHLGAITLPAGFSILTPYAATVAPKTFTSFTVRFNPTTPGASGGNIQIAHDATPGAKFTFTVSATANGGAFKVNFQPGQSEVPDGYLIDAGSVFGTRGNGYTYGWDNSIAVGMRERNAVGDQTRDTFVHTQLFGSRTWEVAVPNGTYTVHLVAGDPSFTDSVYKVNVEGVLTVNGTPNVANHFVEGTKTVTVTDGKLTISNAPGAVNNKLDFVEITPVYHVNFQTTTSPTPSGYLADSGAVFGPRTGGLSYGWNQSASTFARDRNSALSQDQRYDTFIHTQAFGNRTWDLALPNGSYSVHIVAGDPSFFDSVYKFAAEGTTVVSGTPTNSKHWIEGTVTVLVLDGKLTITNASGAVNNKIAFIDVTAM